MNERVIKLREQSLNAVPSISIERAKLVTEVYKKYEGTVSIPMLRALVFKNIMENKELCINDGEIIVGERGERPAATSTYPELCCHTLDDFEIMNKRKKISYKVSDEIFEYQKNEIIPFWENRALRGKILSSMTDEWKECYSAGIFTEFMEQRGPGHTVADGKIYKRGFLDFKKDIEKAAGELDFLNDPKAFEKKEQLDAMAVTCDAIMKYAGRYADYAAEKAASEKDPVRKSELEKIALNCRRVPAYPPETFEQAVQMYWFVHIAVVSEMNNWDSFNPGRLDQHLYPFYRKETEEGTLDRDQAREILECLWVKFNNQPAPPKVGVTLKESGTYTDFANINSGGLTAEGEDGVNDVTYLVLDVISDMHLLQPSSNVQVSKKNPNKFVKRACEVIREGWGQPSVFNADAVVSEMVRAGKKIEDARDGGTSGCVETGAFGKESYILTGYMNLTKIMEITLYNGLDKMTGKKLGLETGKAEDFQSFDDFFNAFKKQLDYFINIKIHGNNTIEKIYSNYMPVPFLSVIIDDCIKEGKDYNSGGARYNTRYIQGVGIGSITDSFSSIKKHVFDEKNLSMKELLEALDNDFQDPSIHNLFKNKTPKYGNDDDYADDLMKMIFDSYFDSVDGRPTMNGGQYRINMLPTTCHVYFGSVIGATPDGRKSGMPLSEGISPATDADRNGPTAVVKSAAKMDHLRTGGTLLNQKFSPSVLEGDSNIDKLVALIRSYFKLDGHHIQFNVVDKKILLKAQENPEQYSDLIVRVAGYSDYFNNLEKPLQDEIINRTEQNFGC